MLDREPADPPGEGAGLIPATPMCGCDVLELSPFVSSALELSFLKINELYYYLHKFDEIRHKTIHIFTICSI